jgi:uncharacterized damage-inducible protein DinB
MVPTSRNSDTPATAPSPDVDTLVRAITEVYEGPAWHGPSVRATLRGLSAADALRRPGPERNSIWELVLHLAYARHRAIGRLARARGQGAPTFARKLRKAWFPELPAAPDAASWSADRALLAEEQELLLDAVSSTPAGVLRQCRTGKSTSLGAEILGLAFHDAYHAGQIRLLARLGGA